VTYSVGNHKNTEFIEKAEHKKVFEARGKFYISDPQSVGANKLCDTSTGSDGRALFRYMSKTPVQIG